MTTTTVLPDRPLVKPAAPAVLPLKDGVTVRLRGEFVGLEYRSQLQSGMDLDDAIRMAQAVLRHAEACGISVKESAADIRLFPPDWSWKECTAGVQTDY